jgi:tRNA(fMet)-specific endonuclease VapC
LTESRKRRALEIHIREEVKAKLVILPYTLEAAEWYAEERARLGRIGRTPPYVDGQIAAIAIVNDLILVTNNIPDYVDFDGLQLQNWFMA